MWKSLNFTCYWPRFWLNCLLDFYATWTFWLWSKSCRVFDKSQPAFHFPSFRLGTLRNHLNKPNDTVEFIVIMLRMIWLNVGFFTLKVLLRVGAFWCFLIIGMRVFHQTGRWMNDKCLIKIFLLVYFCNCLV